MQTARKSKTTLKVFSPAQVAIRLDPEEQVMATKKRKEREITRNEPHARAAHYDEKAGRIVVDLTDGAQFAFPPKIAQGLARAKKADLKEIVVSPKGTGLHWPKLDADLTVAGLLAGIFGSRMWMRELASSGGKAVSERKVAAAGSNDVRKRLGAGKLI